MEASPINAHPTYFFHLILFLAIMMPGTHKISIKPGITNQTVM
ncbi:hypothetical protein SAMN04515668_4880 [Hymenobacter arizonensis]|uniref:Uncharacterized protein n=1 Tax=Hymenobacter arizonensis TaxID=1227077 RepID=A0A1I6BPA5_HYMAR|nr:hypothetical protein SAMN04515668_4880 [Hymenobacter arizonensis]